MTREEEIHNAAMDVSNRWKRSEILPTQDEIIAYDAAVTMAEWCDSHPRKGLWDAEKVCKVLKDYMFKERFFDNRITRTALIDNIVFNLTKAMEK